MLRASTFASSSAIATSAAWPSTLGAVKLALSEPSLLTAQPRIRAMTLFPSATAPDSRLRSTTAAPSLKTVHFVPALKLRFCTPRDSIEPYWQRKPLDGGQLNESPPASASPQPPARDTAHTRPTGTTQGAAP